LPTNQERLALSRKALLKHDQNRNNVVLLLPERVVKLNSTGAAVLQLCDGALTCAQIVGELQSRYGDSAIERDVVAFLADAIARGWVEAR
jgi:pyrroloquinoline quinone biosynthesis protein D